MPRRSTGLFRMAAVWSAVTAAIALTVPLARSALAEESVNEVTTAAFLQQTMDQLAFQEVLDLAPVTAAKASTFTAQQSIDKDAVSPAQRAARYSTALAAASPKPIAQQPQIDASILELAPDGRILGSATVLMSPQYPHGVVVPVDGNHHTTAVRFRQWDDNGWYTNRAQGTIDVVSGREGAALDFMSPYPASVLKLMINFGVLRLVDSGAVSLDDTYAYQPTTISSLCGAASSNTIRAYVDASLAWSSNAASCALVKLLWDHGAVDGLNQEFQRLGLETLRLANTNPANGGRWGNAVTMSSLDTAKLLALVNGGPGTLWTTPAGVAVTRAVLSEQSRQLFLSELGQQGWNWMLSTTNYCGRDYPVQGIPQRTADRWIGQDGTVTVSGNAFGQDVRPCNEAAEVTFAHKPGWVSNTGSDAGIVRSMAGTAGRHYVIAVFSNLGDQYRDPKQPPTPSGTVAVQYTQKFAQLGRAIDRFEAQRGASAASKGRVWRHRPRQHRS